MKGLIIKDLLQLKSYKKNLLYSFIIYSFLIISQKEAFDIITVGTIMITLLFSMLTLATFSYDEKNHADRYILSFPLTRKEIILSKYFLSIIMIVLGSLLGGTLSCILSWIKLNELPNFENLFSTILGGMVGISLIQAIQIPCIYRFGSEKGRMQIYIIALLIGAMGGIIHALVPNLTIDFSKIERWFPIICLTSIILFYLISYYITCKIYQKKEV